MPQWRKLYTKAVESLDINDMPDDFTRLLWLMLPLVVCREGRGLYNASWVRAKTMPLRGDIDDLRVTAALSWYEQRGMIRRYAVAGREYFYIVKWHEHQGDTGREAVSIYPEPADDLLLSNSGVSQELVVTNSCSDADADADTDTEENGSQSAKQPQKAQISKPRAKNPPPPSIRAYQEIARRYPNKSLWTDIVSVVGETDEGLQRWKDTVKGYIAMGWNPNNISGMMDFFKRGEVPHNGNGRKQQEPAIAPTNGWSIPG